MAEERDPLAEFQKALDKLGDALSFEEAAEEEEVEERAEEEEEKPEAKEETAEAEEETEAAYYDRLNSPVDGPQDEPTESEEDHMGLTQMGLAHGRAVPGSHKTFP